jgi:hypothetical protein
MISGHFGYLGLLFDECEAFLLRCGFCLKATTTFWLYSSFSEDFCEVVNVKYVVMRCLSRCDVEDRLEWIYPWKEWVGIPIKYDIGLCEHRVPWFLSLHGHVVVEEVFEDLIRIIVRFPYKKLLFFYDVIPGFVCGYGMRDILDFWEHRDD